MIGDGELKVVGRGRGEGGVMKGMKEGKGKVEMRSGSSGGEG